MPVYDWGRSAQAGVNGGTFSPDEYAAHAVFHPSHPEHARFLAAMADLRLRGPRVNIGNLSEFLPRSVAG